MDQDVQFFQEFLTDVYKIMHMSEPDVLAHSLVKQLGVYEQWPHVIREIARTCDITKRWGGHWAKRSDEVRDRLVAYGIRLERAGGEPLFDKAEEQDMSDEEAALWTTYINGWEAAGATTERLAEKGWEQWDAACEQGVCLDVFLDLFPASRDNPHDW